MYEDYVLAALGYVYFVACYGVDADCYDSVCYEGCLGVSVYGIICLNYRLTVVWLVCMFSCLQCAIG